MFKCTNCSAVRTESLYLKKKIFKTGEGAFGISATAQGAIAYNVHVHVFNYCPSNTHQTLGVHVLLSRILLTKTTRRRLCHRRIIYWRVMYPSSETDRSQAQVKVCLLKIQKVIFGVQSVGFSRRAWFFVLRYRSYIHTI